MNIRVYGEKGGLEWRQEEPNTMVMRWPDRPVEIVRTSNGYMSGIAAHNSRTPGGHPEGYIEAFANLYQALADGHTSGEYPAWLPGIEDGVDGMRFIAAAITSSQAAGSWTPLHLSKAPDASGGAS